MRSSPSWFRLANGHSLFIAILPVIAGILSYASSALAQPAAASVTLGVSGGVSGGGSAVTEVAAGSAVTLTAAVSSGGTAVTAGTVIFCDAEAAHCTDIHVLGTAQLTGGGTASLSLIPGLGSHSYQAVLAGSSRYAGSRSAVQGLTVSGLFPTATVMSESSSAPGVYTLGAVVTGQRAGAGGTAASPGGSISFVDSSGGGAVLGTAPLTAGAGSWSFVSAAAAAAGSGPQALAAGDFNGDGKPDIAVANQGSNTLTILLGNGDGSFTAAAAAPVTGSGPAALALRDFNGDGVLDIAVANQGSNTLTILLGNGDGSFTAAAAAVTGSGPAALAVRDFNGDGVLDIAVANQGDGTLTILLGNGDGSFTAAAAAPATGSGPAALAAGDFNGDGVADIAVANQGSNTLTILLGNGDGSFTAAAAPVTGSGPAALAAGDFNGDGVLDIAVANQGDGTLTILLGNGDGSFTAGAVPAGTPALGCGSGALALGDFNGDGVADLAVSAPGGGAGAVTILTGNGDGTFAAGPAPAPGSAPGALAAADFNGDGTPDLAAALPPAGSVAVLINEQTVSSSAALGAVVLTGSGTHQVLASYPGDTAFAASSSPPVALTALPQATALTLSSSPSGGGMYGQPVTLTAVLTPYTAGGLGTDGETVTFYQGSSGTGTSVGSGTLSGGVATLTLVSLPPGTSTFSAAYAGDTNFSGSVSSSLSYAVTAAAASVTLGVSGGVSGGGSAVTEVAAGSAVTLTAAVSSGGTAVTAGTVIFCDAEAAHCTDIHVLGTAQLTGGGTASLSLIPGLGSHSYQAVLAGSSRYAGSRSAVQGLTVSGLFPTATLMSESSSAPGVYTLGAVVTGQRAGAGGTAASPGGSISFVDSSGGGAVLGTAPLTAGAGSWSFVSAAAAAAGSGPQALAAGDFNGDGKPDIAVANQGSNTLTILLGNGDGSFTAAAAAPVTGSGPAALALRDFNGDGVLDIAVANQGSNTLTILLGNGDGSFTAAAAAVTGSGPAALAVRDFNGDGVLDIAVANQGDGTLTILLGNGDGSFTAAAAAPATGSGPAALAAGDFNGDGVADIAVANQGSNTLTILLGNGDGSFTAAAAPVTGSGPAALAAGDFNGDGVLDIAVANQGDGTLTILLGNGDGSFTAGAVPAGTPALGCGSGALALGDFNGDGVADLAVSAPGGGAGAVTILTGNGDGTFAAGPAPAPGSAPGALAAADFNGDGTPDLAAALPPAGSVAVLINEQTVSSSAALGAVVLTGSGTHQVLASYPGDTAFAASSSPPVALTALPQATLSANSVMFGNGSVNVMSDVQIVTLTNTGNALLNISSIGLIGANPSSFLTSNNCGPGLAIGATCNIRLRLFPQVAGSLTAILSIGDNAPNSPQNIALSGSSTASTVSLSSTSVAFGNGTLNTESNVQIVTLTNTGTGTLAIYGFGFAGANPNSFLTSNNCGAAVSPGASCNIRLRLFPQTTGPLSASLVITDSAPDSPQSISLTGSNSLPAATLSTNTVAFGNGSINVMSDVQIVTMINNGGAPLNISSIGLIGASPNSFLTSNNCGIGLAIGATCNIRLRLFPQTTGQLSATVSIVDNAPDSPQSIALSGSSTAAAVSLSSTNVAFGNGTLGVMSDVQMVTLTNTGSGTLGINGFSLGGANPSSFLTSNNCGASVAAGASCTIRLRLYPQAAGTLTASVVINDTAPDSPQAISLSGSNSYPTATLATNNVVFGNGSLNVMSDVQIVPLTNNGNGPLNISSIGLIGANPNSFLTSNNCGAALAVGATCNIRLRLFPQATGPLTALLSIVDNAPDSPQSIALSGSSTAAAVSLSATNIAFGDGALNVMSNVQIVTLTNTGTGTLAIYGIGLAGTNPNSFLTSNNCGASVAVGASCNIRLRLLPEAAGELTASLVITDSAANSPQSISLTGANNPTVLVLGTSPGNSGTYGQPVTLTASLVPYTTGGYGTDGETVTFYQGSTVLGTGTLSGGVANLTLPLLPVGTSNFSAGYLGDANFSSSTASTITYKVTAGFTTTTLALASAGSAVTQVPWGTAVTMTASVAAAGGVVTSGTVMFCDALAAHCSDIHSLGTAQLTSAGTAALTFVPGIGSHSYKAVLAGTGNYPGSTSSTQTLTVSGLYPTSTLIGQSGGTGGYTLTATVIGLPGSLGTATSPSGSISFLDTSAGGTVLGIAPLSEGTSGWNFVNSQTLGTGNVPRAIVAGDFNGDGKPDLAVANQSDSTLTVLLGHGDGTFTAVAVNPATGSYPTALAAGDFNGDGKVDLAVVNQASNSLTILLGNGDGTFTAAAGSPATGNNPGALAVCDFNSDGQLDITVANQADGTITVLLGNGDGTFTAAASVTVGNNPSALVAGDFNGDGKPDLAAASQGNNSITVMLGNGDGTFAALSSSPATGMGPVAMTAGDFNSDGKVDMATANEGDGSVTVLMGNGDGTFTPAASAAAGSNPDAIAIGDFNGDGKPDLSVANQGSNTLTVLLGNGDGTFTALPASPSTGSVPSGLSVADFNGDGLSDIAVSNADAYSATPLLSQWTSTAAAVSSGPIPVSAGVHQLAASYSGDSNYAAGVSSTTTIVSEPLATLSATKVAFGNGALNAMSAAQVVMLTNTGNAPLNISSIGLIGANPTSFLTSNNCGSALSAGASCNIRLRLEPQISGVLSAAVAVIDNAINSPQVIVLSGSNTGVLLSTANVAFGNGYLGAVSSVQTVTLTNTGNTSLTFAGISITGANPGSFLASNNCGGTVTAGASCSISLQFSPQTTGSLAATLSISDSDQSSPQLISLSGTSVGPILSLSAAGVGFGSQTLGIQSPTQTLTLTNAGNWPLVISSMTLAGPNPGSFVLSNGCGTTLAAGTSCPVQLSFAPQASGPFSASLVIADSTAGSPQIVSLAGAGTAQAPSPSTTNIQFGFAPVGVQSAAQTVILTNNGSGGLTINSISLVGANPTSFLTTTNCGTLAPGASCAVGVTFNPQIASPLTAAVSINYSGDTAPQTIALSGTGTAGPVTVLSANTLTFGSESLGVESPVQTVVLTNSGSAPLGISSVSLAGTNPASFLLSSACGTVVNAGASCTFSIRSVPRTAGALSATLVISDTSPNSPHLVQLTAPAALALTPQALYFGGCAAGTACASQTVTLSNTGSNPLTISSIAVAGPGSAAFANSNKCPTPLPVGGNCAIAVSYQPTLPGIANASLTVTDAAGDPPQSISLNGTGTTAVPIAVVVYGATPAGIAAAIEAAKLGKAVTLLEPSQHIGGMMSNGLGSTDLYGTQPIGGIAQQFFENVTSQFGGMPGTPTYNFAPHMAERTFNSMLAQYPNITLVLGTSLSSVQMSGTVIMGILASNGQYYQGAEFIDSSYTGDLMAAANVSYTVGRESSAQYGESFGGVGIPNHLAFTPVDPYVVPGTPASGLLPHVFSDVLGAPGSADNAVMAYNYRLCLSADPTNQIPFTAPANYNPAEFELLGRLALTAKPPSQMADFFFPYMLQNFKYDLNSSGPVSTDEVEKSFQYPDASPVVRAQIEQEQKRYMQAYLYFISTDPRIPQAVQSTIQSYGLCKDEFMDNGGWPHQLYIREARRMLGAYVMTQNDIQLQTTIPDVVGLGGYTMDDHMDHVVGLNGIVQFEYEGGFAIPTPYPIPYRILTPQASQASNLLVTVDVSASHVAYDSLRVEITYMIMGQAAGAAASLAIDENAPVQNVNYTSLSTQLLSDGAVLTNH